MTWILVGINDVLTAKMFHAPRYRCIFKNVKAPQLNTDQDGKLIWPRRPLSSTVRLFVLRIERHKQRIEPFSQGWMCERAFP